MTNASRSLLTRPCRSCGLDVLWLHNEKTLKPAPIDPTPDEYGNISIDEAKGTYCVLSSHMANAFRTAARKTGDGQVRLYINHFATCRRPQRFQKPARRDEEVTA